MSEQDDTVTSERTARPITNDISQTELVNVRLQVYSTLSKQPTMQSEDTDIA
jgi:hypothetical protein